MVNIARVIIINMIAAINPQTVHTSAVLHQIHVHGHVMRGIMVRLPMVIHHVRHVVMAISVPVVHIVNRVPVLCCQVPQPPLKFLVYPVAVGLTMSTAPVHLIVSVIGISVIRRVFSI